MRDAQESLARLVACSSLWMMSAVAFFSARSGDVAPGNIGLLPILPPVEAEASINEVISVSKHCRQKSDSTLQSRAQGMCRERNQCVTDCRGPCVASICGLHQMVELKLKQYAPLSWASGTPHGPPTILNECSPRRCQYLQPQSRNQQQLSNALCPLASHAYRIVWPILAILNFNVLTVLYCFRTPVPPSTASSRPGPPPRVPVAPVSRELPQ